MKITIKKLKELGACGVQIEIFERLFGNSVEVTEELCLKYYDKFDWDWAAENILQAPAWEAYEKARAQAWEAYEKARAPAWKACEKVQAVAFAASYNGGGK